MEDTDWGSGFLTTYFAPPLKDEKMKHASGRGENAVITAGTFHHGPTCIITRINPTPDVHLYQYGFKTPVDELTQRTFLVQMRNFLIEPENDERFCQRNVVVRDQDIEVLTAAQPELLADRPQELLMPADKAIVRYRQRLAEWEQRGWRIDTDALAAGRRKQVRVIPSPARRESPRGWVLDTVPMYPAGSTGSARDGVQEGGAGAA